MSNVPLKIKMKISEIEKKLCMIIPKVYRDFLLENKDMNFNDGILYDVDAIEERYTTLEFNKYANQTTPQITPRNTCLKLPKPFSSNSPFNRVKKFEAKHKTT